MYLVLILLNLFTIFENVKHIQIEPTNSVIVVIDNLSCTSCINKLKESFADKNRNFKYYVLLKDAPYSVANRKVMAEGYISKLQPDEFIYLSKNKNLFEFIEKTNEFPIIIKYSNSNMYVYSYDTLFSNNDKLKNIIKEIKNFD